MALPENPGTIILKNKFYPTGLSEGMVWKYYQTYKALILNETRGRELMFVIMVDVNKPVIRRKGKEQKFLTLNNSNYDNIITGRTITIYSTMKSYEDFGIIDIDSDDWKKAKQAAIDVYNIAQNFDFIKDVKIRYTGKESFHIICNFPRKIPIDKIRTLLDVHLKNSKLIINQYTVASKRTSGIPNLDLSPNKFRGAFITGGSLSIWGLRCIEMPLQKLRSFQQYHATIK